MYTKNKTGPRTVPWGTSDVTGVSDGSLSRTIVWVGCDLKGRLQPNLGFHF